MTASHLPARPAQQVIVSRETTPPKPVFFVVSVDLANTSDRTAVIVTEVSKAVETTFAATKFGCGPEPLSAKAEMSFMVRHIHRPRHHVDYPAIIDQVRSIMAELPEMPERPTLIVDATGLGGPVVARMRELAMRPIACTITAGNSASVIGQNWTVPKALLVGELRMALHRRLLKVAGGLAERETLATELAAFTARISPSGRSSFEAAGSEHDDTVLSLALGVFAAGKRPQPARAVPGNIFTLRQELQDGSRHRAAVAAMSGHGGKG